MLTFKEAPAGEQFWDPPGFMAKYRKGLSSGVPGPAPSQAEGRCCCSTVQKGLSVWLKMVMEMLQDG